jgi:pimeloyl-ACP methyl ester carboxylesterase
VDFLSPKLSLFRLTSALQGLDWHGPSTEDVWQSLAALSSILNSKSHLHSWAFPEDTRVILLGHSNGGQGAWYVASRFPDKVVAGELGAMSILQFHVTENSP